MQSSPTSSLHLDPLPILLSHLYVSIFDCILVLSGPLSLLLKSPLLFVCSAATQRAFAEPPNICSLFCSLSPPSLCLSPPSLSVSLSSLSLLDSFFFSLPVYRYVSVSLLLCLFVSLSPSISPSFPPCPSLVLHLHLSSIADLFLFLFKNLPT